ncbi:unnamed protein product [Ectocarpus fasciculatus]
MRRRDRRRARKQKEAEEKKRQNEKAVDPQRGAQQSQSASVFADTAEHGGGASAKATAGVKPKAPTRNPSKGLDVLALHNCMNGKGGAARRRSSTKNAAGFGVGAGSVLQSSTAVAAAAAAAAATHTATASTAAARTAATTAATAATATVATAAPSAPDAAPVGTTDATDAISTVTASAAAAAVTAATAATTAPSAPDAALADAPAPTNASDTTVAAAAMPVTTFPTTNSEIDGGASSAAASAAPLATGPASSKPGLQNNRGQNLCCVNSIVQLLRHCPQLLEGLSNFSRIPSTPNRAGTSSTDAAKEKQEQLAATRGMATMMKAMGKPSEAPVGFVNPSLQKFIYNGRDDLRRGQQGDAHQVLMKLLDAFSVASKGDEPARVSLKEAMSDMTPVVAMQRVCSCGNVSSTTQSKEPTLTVPMLPSDGRRVLPGLEALLKEKFATTSLPGCSKCQGLAEVRAHKEDWLGMLRQSTGEGAGALSEAVEATHTTAHTCYDICNRLLDQTLTTLSPMLGGQTSSKRQAVMSAASRLQSILHSEPTEDALEALLVDDAMILLLEGIGHLADETTREEAAHGGRAAQHVRQMLEWVKAKTAQGNNEVETHTQMETSWLKTYPQTVFFYLMRFKHTRGREEKLTHRVVIPEAMDLAPYVSPPTSRGEGKIHPQQYDLTGVVHHIGQTTKKGHYVAFVRLPGQGWIKYDDEDVTHADERDVQTNKALILSYTRRR